MEKTFKHSSTKRTKFGNINILTLRGLRVLRGEMVFTHYSATWHKCRKEFAQTTKAFNYSSTKDTKIRETNIPTSYCYSLKFAWTAQDASGLQTVWAGHLTKTFNLRASFENTAHG